jgi:hypothetical protein
LAVLLSLLAASMPAAFEATRHRVADRYPQFVQTEDGAEAAGSKLTLGMADELHHGRVVTLWLVTAVSADAPTPPGVAALPATGHMVVSPALLVALDQDDSLRQRHPEVVDGVVSPEGLAAPDELFALVGVPEAVGESVAGFGVPAYAVVALMERDAGSLVASELFMLVVLPLLGLLAAASRMAVGVRMTRVAALRLVGLPVRDCARLQGRQLAAMAAVGATLGCLGYQPLSAAVGMSGITGMSWFPEDTAVWWPLLVVLVVGLTAAGMSFGRVSTRAALGGPVRNRVSRRWPRWVKLSAAGLAAACAGLLGAVWAIVGPPKQWQQLPMQYLALAAWIALAGLALVMAGQLTSALVSRLLRGDVVSNPLTGLGLRLARAKPPGTTASQVAMGLFIVVAGFSTVITGTMFAAASGAGKPIGVAVYVSGLGGTEQEAVASLLRSGDYPGYAVAFGQYKDGGTADNAGVDILVADCAVVLGPYDASDCNGEPVVLASADDSGTLKAGEPVTVTLVDGSTTEVMIPDRVLPADDLSWSEVLLIPPKEATRLGKTATTQFDFAVPVTGDDYDTLLTRLRQDSPSAQVTTAVPDPEAREFYARQQSLLQTFTAIGFLFCLLSMCLSGVSMSHDQLRSITALQLIGLTRPRLRASSAISKALPAAIATGCIALATGLGGQALQAVGGMGAEPSPKLWLQTTTATLLAILLAATMGALLISRLDLSKPDTRE